MLLLAALAFTAVLALAGMALYDTIVGSSGKIIAALEGRSLKSGPALVTRPVAVRIVSSRRVSRPLRAEPRLRAAA